MRRYRTEAGARKKVYLGMYANEEDAAQAVANYVEHGTVPAASRTVSSKFNGVSWNKQTRRWQAQITFEGKYSHLGGDPVQLESR